jgi:hypothetical protein
MTWTCERRWLVGLILLSGAVTLGCNPLTAPFFMLYGVDSKLPAEYPLFKGKQKDKQIRVVIVTSMDHEASVECIGVERQLAEESYRTLTKLAEENKEKLILVPFTKVEKYKMDHPTWKTQPAAYVGEYFHADYVIDVSITSMRLFEPGSGNRLYHARADISVQLFDAHRPDDPHLFQKELSVEYPDASGPVDASDTNLSQFRLKFVHKLGTDLAWLFTAHKVEDTYARD